jgi:hypothetical protein
LKTEENPLGEPSGRIHDCGLQLDTLAGADRVAAESEIYLRTFAQVYSPSDKASPAKWS